MIGPRRYGELLNNLAGMGTNLLAKRLQEMEAAGLIQKDELHYALTEQGRQLEEVVFALVRFGLSMNVAADEEKLSRREWDVVALRAIYDEEAGERLEGDYTLRLDGEPFTLTRNGADSEIWQGASDDARVEVTVNKKTRKPRVVHGSQREATKLLRAFGIAGG